MMSKSSVIAQKDLSRTFEFSLLTAVNAFDTVTKVVVAPEADLNKYQGLIGVYHDQVYFPETAVIVPLQYAQAVAF